MLDHVLSYYYDEKVGLIQSQKKADKAGRYNRHFEYKPGDSGFLDAATDGRGGRGRGADPGIASKPKHAKHAAGLL
jgi:hypothetical protein